MTRPRVAIVDTGSGNLRSVEKALAEAGADAQVTADAAVVKAADKLVVPGQGAFGGCVAGLDRGGGELRQVVLESIRAGKPYLGLCLGLQILFDGSDESVDCAGLGILPGRVHRFDVRPPDKVPHMGWNDVRRGPAAGVPGLAGTPDGTYFYFVHSYYPVPANASDVALTSDYGGPFCAAAARDNVLAVQFHPEKSQAAGISLLGRWTAEP
jgi:imidazole glycerol-phosphate synthase subunit HisH